MDALLLATKFRQTLCCINTSYEHNQTVVDGISRIGYMNGGKSA